MKPQIFLSLISLVCAFACKTETGSTLKESGFAPDTFGCVGTENEIARVDRDIDLAKKDFASCTESAGAAAAQTPAAAQAPADASSAIDVPTESSTTATNEAPEGLLQLASDDPKPATDETKPLSAECEKNKRYIEQKTALKAQLQAHIDSKKCEDISGNARPRHYSVCPSNDICLPSQGAECFRCVFPDAASPVVGATCASTQGAKEAINIWCDSHETCGDRSQQPVCSKVASAPSGSGNTQGLAAAAAAQAGAKVESEPGDKNSLIFTKIHALQGDVAIKVEVGKIIVSSLEYKKSIRFDTTVTARFYTENASDIFVERDGRIEFAPTVKYVCTSGKTGTKTNTITLGAKAEIPLVILKVSGSEAVSTIDTSVISGVQDSPPLSVGGKTIGEMVDQCGEVHKERALNLLDPQYYQLVARLDEPSTGEVERAGSGIPALGLSGWTRGVTGPLLQSILRIYNQDGITFRHKVSYNPPGWAGNENLKVFATVPWKDLLESPNADKLLGHANTDAGELARLVLCNYPSTEYGRLVSLNFVDQYDRSSGSITCP